jgi:hypothetical protein
MKPQVGASVRRSMGNTKLAVGLVMAAVPFAFGLVRYANTGDDVRYVWMALASSLGVGLVVLPGWRRGRVAPMSFVIGDLGVRRERGPTTVR